MKKIIILLFAILFVYENSNAQTHHFKFKLKDKSELKKISHIISVDNFKDNTVWAYAGNNEFSEFEKLHYKVEELPLNDSKGKVINMATTVAEMANWDRYPTYSVYTRMMQDFANNYPTICKLDTISDTQNGRKVLVLKISDNVNQNEAEPEFFYTSTMHGDETTGFVLMLRLVDYLLSNYGTDTEATDLINNFEIFINPDANPDGTYYGGDNDVSGSRRYLYNGDDPNRDFPYPLDVNSTSSNVETIGMENFAAAHHFVMSANFHGGAEVYNYPWDCWSSSENAPADATWWEHIGRAYVDSARLQNSSYMTYPISDGVTEGYDWYYAEGTRQDYMNYFHHCKEVTIELSGIKTLSTDQLQNYWNYNKRSLINYIKEASFGFHGTVKNTSGDPLNAKIEITAYDKDSSNVVTDPANGDYYRPIEPGTYNVTYSAFGYTSQIHSITVNDWETTTVKDVILGVDPSAHTLSGTVTEEGTGNPIENVKIEILDTPTNPVYSIANGTYEKIAMEDGTYQVQASKDGYLSKILSVTISGSDETLNFTLKPNVTITGTVTENGTGTPLENVKIEIIDSGLTPVYTDASGNYSIDNVPQTTQNIKASLAGYTSVTQTVDISTTTVVDFTLSISNAVSFESNVPSFFTFSGDSDWSRVTPEAYDGDYSMKSGDISNNQISVMETELNITAAGNISFYKKVSSESGYDYLKFYIDGVQQGSSWSGEVNWSQETFPVTTTGIHTFKWEYSKDGSVSNGSDCAWVDYIEFPQYEIPPTYTVTFNVTDGTNPIENANINFNSQDILTDATGKAIFNNIPEGNNLPYIISKSGFLTFNGTLNVNSNINQTISLTTVNVDVILKLSGLKFTPNPFKDFVSIQFYSEEKANTIIYIYSYSGQLVKSINIGNLNAGNHEYIWNASGLNGEKVKNGIYFIKIQSGNNTQTGKLILVN